MLLIATVLLGIPVPMVFLGLIILSAALATLIRPEIGLHVLVLNAVVGLTHLVEIPRAGPISAPVLIEGLVLVAILFQAAFMRRSLPIGTPVHALMGLLAVWILLSILTGVSVGPENFRQYRNLFLVRLVIFVLVTAIVTTRDHVKRLVGTLLIANVGLLVVATLLRTGQVGDARIPDAQAVERATALVQNPNELAFGLTTMFVLSIFTVLYVRGPLLKGLLLALAGANLFFILSTLSRSGFISLCMVLLFLLLRLTRNARAVSVMLVLAFAGWLMIPDALFSRFAEIDQVKDVDRFRMMRVGTAMALDHPLTGVGFGNYVPRFWEYNVGGMKRAAPSHNMYLDLAAQMGLPALALFLTAYGIAWRRLVGLQRSLERAGRTRSFEYLFGLAVQAFFVNLAVFGMSGDVEFDYTAFIMLGLSLTLAREGGIGASGRN